MSKLGTKSWSDILKEIPSDTIAAEAAAGAAVGAGANYVSNSSSGDRGGYLGAGILGAAGGAAARPVLSKRANTKAVNLQEAKIQADTAAAEAKERALVERQRKAIASGRRQLEGGSKKTGIIERVKNSIFTNPAQDAMDQNKAFFGPQNNIPAMGPLPTMKAPPGFYDPAGPLPDNSFRAQMLRSADTLNEYQRGIDTAEALNNLSSIYN